MVIEVDGGQHAEQNQVDKETDNWLTSRSFTVLRFWDNEVLNNIEEVVEIICKATPPSLAPPIKGGEVSVTSSRQGREQKYI